MRLWAHEGFPIKLLTKAVEVPRSLYYYHINKQKEKTVVKKGRPYPGYSKTHTGVMVPDEKIEEILMEAVEGEEGVYGYHKLTEYLRDTFNLNINHKKVYRMCGELGILLPRRKASSFPRRLAKQHYINGPNQLWQLDIKYGSINGSGRFFFLACAIDVFDRCIVGYYRGPVCKAKDITNMLQEALLKRQVHLPQEEEKFSLIIRTDNGPQFTSYDFGEFCEHHKVFHERIPPKSPNLNAFIESFHSIIERECYQRYIFDSFDEAYLRVDEYIEFYNKRRYHGSLNYMSPLQFNKQYMETGFIEEMAISL
ncbi:IS3 family transposase [Metabacillus sp. B2-18]|uniref:IS3 family transposase n=1 Tax=Bacillus sp. AFS040349 TaxID=2033502 RepID=UPI001E5F2014|nr:MULTISPECIES: IS3 family transposase [Bacillaceae]UGB33428.1 IS3 family transposase [Metabacillus sp. B2-18]